MSENMIIVGDYAPGSYSVDVNIGGNRILANLEGPILPRKNPLVAVPKAGPSLSSIELPSNSTDYIFSLANNHIMDFGRAGMEATIRTLHQHGMHHCGSGDSIYDARKPLIIQNGDLSIGIISCCEAQFGIARLNQSGVAEFGPWIYEAIRDLSGQVDRVIVSVHAGVEDSPWPSPYIRDLYHSFIDAGATLVHGHHAHVPQGYEQYREGVIFYGLGNFAVDPIKWQNFPNGLWSLGAEIVLNSKPLKWRLIPLEIRYLVGSKKICIEESSPEERECHMHYLELCNRPLHDDALFEALWQEVAVRAYYAYGGHYMGLLSSSRTGRFEFIIESLSILKKGVIRRFCSINSDQQRLLLYYHMVACESHRQMLTTALGVLSGEIRDLRTDESRRLAHEMLPWKSSQYSPDPTIHAR